MSWTAHGRLWWTVLGAERLQLAASEEERYEVLADRAPNEESVELSLVEKDVGRTFPDRAEFTGPAARQRLRRVLSCRRRLIPAPGAGRSSSVPARGGQSRRSSRRPPK